MAPSGKLRFKKAKKNTAPISSTASSDEMLDFNELTDSHTSKLSSNVSTGNENQTQVSKMTTETAETVSTLTMGSSVVAFDSFTTKWNLREAVKNVLFHKKPYINDQSELEFSDNNDSVCAIIMNELNASDNHETKKECWKQIKGYVPSFLNKKRTTIVQTIVKNLKVSLVWNSIEIQTNDLPLTIE